MAKKTDQRANVKNKNNAAYPPDIANQRKQDTENAAKKAASKKASAKKTAVPSKKAPSKKAPAKKAAAKKK